MMKKITILLSTYNGEKYIKEQIDSLLAQKNVEIKILVRDDESTDQTQKILQEYSDAGLLEWYKGSNIKPANSYMNLMKNAPKSDYYAFCDQDDYWLDDKMEIAIKALEQFPQDKPALYYGRARLVDDNLCSINNARTSSDVMLNINSALINSNATGCTMVFNKKLLDIVNEKKPMYISMHDGWIHKVCIISHGNIFVDDDVHILYRQHDNNVIGCVMSKKEKVIKHYSSFKNKDCIRSRTISSLVECYGDRMSEEDYRLCKLVSEYKKSFLIRLKIVFNKKIRTNYLWRNFLFKMAILLKIF